MAYNRLSMYETTISADATHTVITYRKTQIVRFNSAEIVLNFGGWDTVTTRRKMNQASHQFNLGYSVWRDKGETWIGWKDVRFGAGGRWAELRYEDAPDKIVIQRPIVAQEA